MTDRIRITTSVAQVLAVLLTDPTAARYGLDLMRATGQPSGTLYPILGRLQAAGWVRADWEDISPAAEGRPARRYYLLTADGARAARTELAALQARLQPRPAGPAGATGGVAAADPLPGW